MCIGGLGRDETDRGGGWRIEKIFMSPKTFLEMMEDDGSILKDEGGYIWNSPLPICWKDQNKTIFDYGGIPLCIDEFAPEWAIVWEEK